MRMLVTGGAGFIQQETPNCFQQQGLRQKRSGTLSGWSYACSKAIDEFLAMAFYQQYGLRVVIGRFFNTIGPSRPIRDGGSEFCPKGREMSRFRYTAPAGSKSKKQFVPHKKAYGRPIENMMRRAPNLGRIKKALGWEPKTCLTEALCTIIESENRKREKGI